VHGIAQKSVPINVIIYYPTTEKGNKELANRVGYVHADLIQQFIQKLNYSPNQKVQLETEDEVAFGRVSFVYL